MSTKDCDNVADLIDDDDDDRVDEFDGIVAGELVVGVVVDCVCGPESKVADAEDDDDDDDDGDVSLAEVLRANSEMLNRMCRGTVGGGPPLTPETADLEERLPDLINDIDVLGESLHAAADTPSDFRHLFAADESPECCATTVQELRRPLTAVDDGDDDDPSAEPAKPFAPFPSKVRQPKRLGIELGLYPDDGSN